MNGDHLYYKYYTYTTQGGDIRWQKDKNVLATG